MRTPFQGERERDTASLRSRLNEATRYMWHQPFLRTCALIFGPLNFVAFSLLFSLVVIGNEQGLRGGAIGLLLSAFFGVALLGTFLAKHVRAALPPWGVLILELWTWTCCVAFVIWPNVYVLAVSILPSALALPSTDSVVHGYRMAMTPERLLGRAEAGLEHVRRDDGDRRPARDGLRDPGGVGAGRRRHLCGARALDSRSGARRAERSATRRTTSGDSRDARLTPEALWARPRARPRR